MPRSRTVGAIGFAGLALAAATSSAPALRAADEVRALWVVRTSLASPAAVENMVTAARASGFNTLLVQIRGRGDAYYTSALEPRAAPLVSQPAFDPLAITIAKAHEAGLGVHAWVNVNLVAGTDLPRETAHIIYRHPEWLMVPRGLGEDLAALDPSGPEYLGRLTRFARSQSSEVEGLYLSPGTSGAIDYTTAVVRDIATRYPVDGVHFDYIRYPNDDFDYSRETLAAFHRSLAADLTPADVRRYGTRLATEPLVYTEAFPERWRAFRAERLTALVARLRAAVKAVRPAAIVSAAVAPDPREAVTRRLQDWQRWLTEDLIDVLCPMAYTTDGAAFVSQIATAQAVAGRHPLWAGIGAYRLSHDQTMNDIQAARRLGVGGIILFSYDSLIAPARGSGYLSQLGKAAFSSRF